MATNTYECMVLLDNREVRKGWDPAKELVSTMFTKHGAEILSARRWDERPLAYPINRQSRGTYLLVYAKSPAESVASIRREMELSESVLRNIVLVCDEVPGDAYEPEPEFDVNAIPEDDAPVVEEEPEAEAKSSGKSDGDGEKAKGKSDGDGEKAEGKSDGDGEKAEGKSDGDGEKAEGKPDGDGEKAEGKPDGDGEKAEGDKKEGEPAEGGADGGSSEGDKP